MRDGLERLGLLPSDDRIWTWTGIAGLVFLGVALGSLAGFLIQRGVRTVRLEQRLRREGALSTARVIAVVQSGWKNREPLWVIRYRYQDAAGTAHEGRCVNLSHEEAARWKVGDTSAVRYDPQRPAASVWLGGQRTNA
jgi:hypothetical protein